MTDLNHALRGQDLGYLRLVANAWGVEMSAPDAPSALPGLVDALTDRSLLKEVFDSLPVNARDALHFLMENGGRVSWALFTRRFGQVRPFGPARRDRERPDLKPVSPAEILWYRALIGKAFMDLPPEPQEYAFIPDDFLDFLLPHTVSRDVQPGRPASPAETAVVRAASDAILDHATTLLAALRIGLPPEKIATTGWIYPPRHLMQVLLRAGILDRRDKPHPDHTREFLEAPRAEALLTLVQTWRYSPDLNDLRNLPGLIFEGEWQNNPAQARQAVLDWLCQVPPGQWWHLNSFVNHIHTQQPDYQRPAGDYDSWSIRRAVDNSYLRGFSDWQFIDGALVRYLVTMPMAAFGLVDLAADSDAGETTAFRINAWGEAMLQNLPPSRLPPENGKLKVNAEGEIHVEPGFPRALRYQVARFCDWLEDRNGSYRYLVTPAALERATSQGLRPAHLAALLKKVVAGQVPPTLLKALERLDKFGVQASVRLVSLLRVATPEMLTALRSSRAGRFIGEGLNPTTAEVKPAAVKELRRALAEMGYLGQFDLE